MPDIAHDADNLSVKQGARRAKVLNSHTPSNRINAGKEDMGKGLVYDDDMRRLRCVVISKWSAVQQRDFNGREIVGADDPKIGVGR